MPFADATIHSLVCNLRVSSILSSIVSRVLAYIWFVT